MQATTAREHTGTKFTSLSTHRLKTKAKCSFFRGIVVVTSFAKISHLKAGATLEEI